MSSGKMGKAKRTDEGVNKVVQCLGDHKFCRKQQMCEKYLSGRDVFDSTFGRWNELFPADAPVKSQKILCSEEDSGHLVRELPAIKTQNVLLS